MDSKVDLKSHGLLVGLKGSRSDEVEIILNRHLIDTHKTFFHFSTALKLNMLIHHTKKFLGDHLSNKKFFFNLNLVIGLTYDDISPIGHGSIGIWRAQCV